MATHLQQLLRSMCWETEWDYAVFWKLKCRDRMVLTWEDGYFRNQNKLDPSESNSINETFAGFQDGHVAHGSLSLAVTKMSYHVHSLGEGVVGQVAVTGKHQWIFAGEHAMNSCSSFELCNSWEAQVAAGIKTIVVAAVLPQGVIQLGSLNKVNENLQFLDHIRDAFSSIQESVFQIPTPMQFNLQHMPQMSDISRIFSPDVLQDYLLDEASNRELNPSNSADVQSLLRHLDHSQTSMPNVHLNETVGTISEDGLSETINNFNTSNSNSSKIHKGGANDNMPICYPSQSCITSNTTLYDGKITGEKYETRFKHSPADYCESAAFSTAVFDGGNHLSKDMISELYALDPLAKHMAEDKLEVFPEFDCSETSGNLKPSFMFSAGTELHEALGPAFLRQCYSFPREVEKPEDSPDPLMPEATENSLLTSDSSKDHLLEAVVANFCKRDALKKSNSFSTSDSMLTTERMTKPYTTGHTLGSACYPLGLNAPDSCSIRPSTSECRKQLDMSVEPGKPNKKRARPGENSRPRPRDRQLIQDRIKELRELVPNGSKCSIDSLLERTIKHMAFMQNVTKHSDKLSDRAKSKGCSETGVQGSGDEQGSSWAVEVGGHMKICPIIVKDFNINGQMLIEMLCDDCDHFLEITDAIKGLGLTILKGNTDSHGDKTWMRFVVEGQSNRKLHRMEVLWSLIHILQSKTIA
ncbi:hypothetical protein vseg_003258 [Gypsophila vaccaria]